MFFRLSTRDGKEVLAPSHMDYLPNPDTVFDLSAGTFSIAHVPPKIKMERIHGSIPRDAWVTTLKVEAVKAVEPEPPIVPVRENNLPAPENNLPDEERRPYEPPGAGPAPVAKGKKGKKGR
jgi:hypothetical protein